MSVTNPLATAVQQFDTVVKAPGNDVGYWAGAPSAIYADDAFWLTYRLRLPIGIGRGVATVVARSEDGINFETIWSVEKDIFGAESFERPAIVKTPGGKWQLYLSCATPGSKHWWIDVLEADDPASFDPATRRTAFAGDELFAMKDPIVKWVNDRCYAWICCHPLDIRDAEDRMTTRLAFSDDTEKWLWVGDVLKPRRGTWDERGARIADVVIERVDNVMVYYDGRATAEENCEERTGLAYGPLDGPYVAKDGDPIAEMPGQFKGLRYLSVVPSPKGTRLYYEASLPDGSHELRTSVL
jgi:hypothetical protein